MTYRTPSVGTYTAFTTAASNNVPYPTVGQGGVAAGDVLVLFYGSKGSNPTTAITSPGGWTNQYRHSSTTDTALPALLIATKYAVGNEAGTTLTVTHSSGVDTTGQIFSCPGGDQTTLLDVAIIFIDNTSAAATTAAIPTATTTPTIAGAMALYAALQNASAGSATPPTGFTEGGDRPTAAVPNTLTMETGWKIGLPASAMGTSTVNFAGSGRTLAAMIVLRPKPAVASTRATTWRTLSGVASVRLTTWDVLTTVAAATRSTTWRVLGAVTSSRATTWRTLASTASSRATTWRTLASVASSRLTTWRVMASTAVDRLTTWRVLSSTASSRPTTWDVLTSVASSRVTTWRTLASTASSRLTTWNVNATVVVTKSVATTWRVLASVASSRQTTWDDLTTTTASRPTTWRTLQAVGPTRSTTWRVLERVGVSRPTTWRVLASVTSARQAIWRVLKKIASVRSTTWNVIEDPPLVANPKAKIGHNGDTATLSTNQHTGVAVDAMGQNDLLPDWSCVLSDGSVPYDASTADSVIVKGYRNDVLLIDREADSTSSDGTVTLQWVAGETDDPGPIKFKVIVTKAGFKTATFPPRGWMITKVHPIAP